MKLIRAWAFCFFALSLSASSLVSAEDCVDWGYLGSASGGSCESFCTYEENWIWLVFETDANTWCSNFCESQGPACKGNGWSCGNYQSGCREYCACIPEEI